MSIEKETKPKWNEIATLNELNRMDDSKKTNIAILLERVLREKISKDKKG